MPKASPRKDPPPNEALYSAAKHGWGVTIRMCILIVVSRPALLATALGAPSGITAATIAHQLLTR